MVTTMTALRPDTLAESRSEGSGMTKHEEEAHAEPKLDPNGIPLSPQPTEDPMDPLNWSPWLKFMVLAQVSLLSFMSLLSASLITPTFVPLSKYLHRDVVTTAYITSSFILSSGVSPVIWNPIANVYGRRPVYLFSLAVAVAVGAGSGAARNYGSLVTLRVFSGFFGGVPLGLGSATVCDLFFAHERGLYMGIYTISFVTGGHIAPLIGGFIEASLTWRWCFFVPAIISGALLFIFAATVPETLYARSSPSSPSSASSSLPPRTWTSNLLMTRRAHPTKKLRLIDLARPFQMMRYPSVLLPTCAYALCFSYNSTLVVLTGANLFGKLYHYQPRQTGVLLGVPITVGSLIGELFAGGLSDWISERRALKRGGHRSPEDRLLGILPAVVLCPLGLIIEGVCLQKKTHWIGVAMGLAICSAGLQVASTAIYTYTAECYKPQSPELGCMLNFSRHLYGFTVGFYAIPFAERVGVQNAWITLAMLIFAGFLPLIPLYFKGAAWRERLGKPSFNKDQ